MAENHGSPLDPDVVTHAYAEMVRGAGLLRMQRHDLRHSHHTRMPKQGVHPKVVSGRLGDARIGTTLDTYPLVLPGLQEEAVERFDNILG